MKPPYLLERALPERVAQYLDEYGSKADVIELTEYLMNTYQEFSAKKRSIFMKSVQKAYDYEMYIRARQTLPRRRETNSPRISEDEIQVIPPSETMPTANNISQKSKLLKTHFNVKNDALQSTGENEVLSDAEDSSKKQKLQSSTPQGSAGKRRLLDSAKSTQDRIPKRRRKNFTIQTQTDSLEDLVLEDRLNADVDTLISNFLRPRKGFNLPKSALVTGSTGSGKSALIKGIAGQMKASYIYIQAADFVEGISGNSEERVEEAFDLAVSSSSCVLHLDKIDVLSSKDSSSVKGLERRICSKIKQCLQDIIEKHWDKKVLVFAESSYPDKMESELKSSFQIELFMPTLNEESRLKLLQLICGEHCLREDLRLIAQRTVGYVAGDLRSLHMWAHINSRQLLLKDIRDKGGSKKQLDRESMHAKFCSKPDEDLPPLSYEDFRYALTKVTPVLKKEGFPSVPEVTWDDIGGLEDIKLKLKEQILDPIVYSNLYDSFSVQRPNGILLWGPPGCGKTLLAKAVANTAGINFYPVNSPEILNKYQGESERTIREIFQRAVRVAPCIIFFDEFDVICPNRKLSGESGSKNSIVASLLTQLQGYQDRKNVHVLAATNAPELLDPAVTRPGRFDTLIYVGLPDLQGRESILRATSKNGECPKFASDVNLKEIAGRCQNFSGADCSSLVYTATKFAIREIKNTPKKLGSAERCVHLRHFEKAFEEVNPSVEPEQISYYKKLKEKKGESKFSSRKRNSPPVIEVDADENEFAQQQNVCGR